MLQFVAAMIIIVIALATIISTIKTMNVIIGPIPPYEEPTSKWWVVVMIILWALILTLVVGSPK